MNTQLELFDDNNSGEPEIEIDLCEDSKQCVKCKEVKPLTDFRLNYSKNKNIYRPECRECEKEYNKSRIEVSKNLVRPPLGTPCDCCGRTDKELLMDHCHKTEEHRGWLCQSCNIGIGRLGDCIDGLLKAVAYLKRHYLGE
jgi:hypothetical protein